MEIIKITKRRVAAGAPVAKLLTKNRNRKPRNAIKRKARKTPAWRIRLIREFWASLKPRVATDLLVRLQLRQRHGREYIDLPPWCASHPFTCHLKNVKWTDRSTRKWEALAKAGAQHIEWELEQQRAAREEEDW